MDNRIADAGYGYDSRGNLNLLPTGERYLYDGENRQVVYCAGFVSAGVAFFATFDQKMNEFASQSPLISNPDSWWSMVNPFNYLVENAALVEAFAAADAADRAEAKREEEERKKRREE